MTGSGLRKRKKFIPDNEVRTKISVENQNDSQLNRSWATVFGAFWITTGFCTCIFAGYWFSEYVKTLHENQMWFTNIQQVEREISLRTECGLYYSYYKQLLSDDSFDQGERCLLELTNYGLFGFFSTR